MFSPSSGASVQVSIGIIDKNWSIIYEHTDSGALSFTITWCMKSNSPEASTGLLEISITKYQ
jgi:hypothetical protein